MEHKNLTSYKPGTFVIDISQFEPAAKFFEPKDMPAVVHEYCHYIQDISTISSIMGFSLWMWDVVNLTKIFSTGQGQTIAIPLEKDQFGESINKYRKYYSLYCGDPDDIFEIDYSLNSFVQRHFHTSEINLNGKKRVFGINEIELKNRPEKIFFGLIALQEIHAFYAQKLAEARSVGVELSIYADKLPSYPYKFGDYIFNEYKIEIDLPSKFILIGLCLDTVQATTVFWKVLEELRGGKVSYFGPDRMDLESVVDKCSQACSYSIDDALVNILPDLKNWATAEGRDDFRSALAWYVRMIEDVYYYKNVNENSTTLFLLPFIGNWADFARFYQAFHIPAFIKNGVLFGNVAFDGNEDDNIAFTSSFEAATTFWAHRIVYDLLTIVDIKQLNKRGSCPLYEGCEIKIQLGEEYTCYRAPWEIIKGKEKAPCVYGLAVHSFGLWQNSLDIKI